MGSRGQATVEYILLVAVMVGIALGGGSRIRQLLVGDLSCPNSSLYCQFLLTFQGVMGKEQNFREFRLRR